MQSTRTISFSYAQVESALAELLEIPPSQLGAFAARLRHLRALNVPRYSKPGSGKRLSYQWTHVAQMMVALLFQSLGCAPRLSAEAAWAAEKNLEAAVIRPDMVFALLNSSEFGFFRLDQLPELVNRVLACATINLSNALTQLDARLANHV